MIDREKINQINSNRKPTVGFSEKLIMEASKRAFQNRLLWLDDIRNPYLDVEGKVSNIKDEYDNIIWVKNYDEFVDHINNNGLPKIISFDHDLGLPVALEARESGMSKRQSRKLKQLEKTGMDCAKFLVDYCIDNNLKLPKFYVHSANPVGAENISSLLNNFKKYYEK